MTPAQFRSALHIKQIGVRIMTAFTRNFVEKNPYVAADHIEELERSLREMLGCYWGNGDNDPAPDFIKRAAHLCGYVLPARK